MSMQEHILLTPDNHENIESSLEVSSEEFQGELVDIFLKKGIVTPNQLAHTRRVLSKLETPRSLTSLLKELNFISDDQIIHALQNTPISMPLGKLLVELGYIDNSELHVAMDIQAAETSKRDLDGILVDQNLIGEKELMQVWALKLGLPYIEPQFSQIDHKLFRMAPIKWYSEHNLIPMQHEDRGIRIAFANPHFEQQLETARQVFGNGILPAIISKSALGKVLEWARRESKKPESASSSDNAVVKLVNRIILAAIERNASDIHIEPLNDKLRVRFRQDGVLIHFEDFPTEVVPSLTNRIKVMCNVDITEKRRHQGGRILFEYPEGELDLRVSFYVAIHGEKIVIRLLNRKGLLLNIEDVGMSSQILERFKTDALYQPSGVILISGPTGSGKTTTVYSCIHSINNPQTSIITAEEPVEYVIDGITQCSINPKINLTFEETLRHIVRQDPDVIVIGEIRDNFSAEVAVQAALTGHKVLTTFHTEDSIGGLIRLLKMNIEAFLISSTVVSVLAQRLVRRVCPNCGVEYKPNTSELQRLGYTSDDIAGMTFRKGGGCSDCLHTGYKGRVGVFELLVLDECVRNAIIDLKTSQEIRRISIESTGLVTLFEDGVFKAASGITTIDEVLRCLPKLQKPRPLQDLKRYIGGI